MKTVIVSSKNPVKIAAVKEAFESMLPDETYDFEGISVSSDVSDQPMGEEETFTGALNRVENAAKAKPNADFWVGLEGGCEKLHEGMAVYAWMTVKGKSAGTMKLGKARSSTFFLPDEVARLVDTGMELGDADDIVFSRSNSKQANGSIGLLTQDAVTRKGYYVHALKLALIPFLPENKNFY